MATFEYRKLFRADAVIKVEFTEKDGSGFKGIGFSKTISQTGINIVVDKPLEEGSVLDLILHIELPGGPVRAKGVVVWKKECMFVPESGRKYYSVGVQINEMSSGDAIRESDYVRDFLIRKSEEQNRKLIQALENSRRTTHDE